MISAILYITLQLLNCSDLGLECHGHGLMVYGLGLGLYMYDLVNIPVYWLRSTIRRASSLELATPISYCKATVLTAERQYRR